MTINIVEAEELLEKLVTEHPAKVTIEYPGKYGYHVVKQTDAVLPPDVWKATIKAFGPSGKIPAIRFVRTITTMSLSEAKRFVEGYLETP